MFKKLFTLISFLGVSSSALSISLEEALVSCYKNNPELAAARESLKKADEEIFKAFSGFLPQLKYEATERSSKIDTKYDSATKQLVKNDQWITIQNRTSKVELKQNIFNGGKNTIAAKIAKYTIESERAMLISKEQDLFYKTISAFFAVINNKQKLSIAKENIEFYEKKYEFIKDKYNHGFARESDVANALAKRSDAETNYEYIEAEYNSSMADYTQLVGEEPENLSKPTILLNIPLTKREVELKAFKSNPELKAITLKQKGKEMAVKSNLASMLPSIDAGISFMKIWNNDKSTNVIEPYQNNKTYYVSVKIPIYQNGQEYSNVRQSKADAAQSKYETKSYKFQITKLVSQAWHDYNSARSMVKSSKDAVKAGELALSGKQIEYEEGQISLTELLEIQENLFTYKVKLADAVKNLELKKYYIIAIMGELNARSMKLRTKYYDVTENYNRIKYKLAGF